MTIKELNNLLSLQINALVNAKDLILIYCLIKEHSE